MTRLRIFLCAIVLFAPLGCFADSVATISNLSVNFKFFPNDGSGDNMGGYITGKNVNLLVDGGTPYDWFNNGDNSRDGNAPGSIGGGSTNIFFEDASGTIGKNSGDFNIGKTAFDAGSFTFPTDGSGFTAIVPASLEMLVLFNCPNNGCHYYNLITVPGTLTLNFAFDPDIGVYYGVSGTFTATAAAVPEPATFGLLASGLAMLPWRKTLSTIARRARRQA